MKAIKWFDSLKAYRNFSTLSSPNNSLCLRSTTPAWRRRRHQTSARGFDRGARESNLSLWPVIMDHTSIDLWMVGASLQLIRAFSTRSSRQRDFCCCWCPCFSTAFHSTPSWGPLNFQVLVFSFIFFWKTSVFFSSKRSCGVWVEFKVPGILFKKM